MAEEITGAIIEKGFRPPIGIPYLMIDVPNGPRMTIVVRQSVFDQVTFGDVVRFKKPWRKNKAVKNIEILERAHVS